jgi:hypothetical protein
VRGRLELQHLGRQELAALAVILLAPLIGVLVVRAPLMNNLPYRDPWFYSGYAWTLAHHIEIFGWFYYSVRFPVILPIRWATDLFGPVTGYLVLRYVIFVGTGAIVYACFRRFASLGTACTAVVLLAMSSFYLRMVLWDYTSFVAVPCSIAGVAIWFMASVRGRVGWQFVVAGALLGAAVFANVLSASVVAAMLLVDGIVIFRRGPDESLRFALRCGAALLGALFVFFGGYLAYAAYLGPFKLSEIVSPTIEFLRNNNQLAAPLQRPASEFLRGEPRVYAPVLLSLGVVVALGRRFLTAELPGRLAQFAVAYVGLIWLYRFTVTSSVVETWWAYNMTAVSVAYGLPLVVYGLSESATRRAKLLVIGAAIAATAITSFVVRTANIRMVIVSNYVKTHLTMLVLLLCATAVVTLMLRLRWPFARAVAVAAFASLFAAISLIPATYIGINQPGEFAPDSRGEYLGYRAAYDMSKLLQGRDQPDSRVLLWTTLIGLPMIAWTDLPHQGGSILSPDTPVQSLTDLPPPALDLVRYPTTHALLVLSENPADMTSALSTLHRFHVGAKLRARGVWADGHLHYELVDVSGGTG